MFLQLAESNRVNVRSYKRKPKVKAHTRAYPLNEGTIDSANPYIFVPNFETGGGLFIREDKFDSMPEHQFKIFVQTLAPYQPGVRNEELSEAQFLASRADRREARARRREAKTQRKEARAEAKKAKTERKNARAESKNEARAARAAAKQTRADAKLKKSESGSGFDIDKAKEVGGSLIDKFVNKGGSEAEAGATSFNYKPLLYGGLAVVTLAGVAFAINKARS